MLIGLLIGVALVVGSLFYTRWLAGRRAPSPAVARRREQQLWVAWLVCAALIYVGFSLRPGGAGWVPVELAGVVAYTLLGMAGLRWGAWMIGVGWGLHGVWDFVVHAGVAEDFVPTWYRQACLSYDEVMLGYWLWMWRRERRAPTQVVPD